MNLGRCHLLVNYKIERQIGQGAFGVVWKARHLRNGTVFAIKEIDKNSFKGNNMVQEIYILSQLKHPNIVRLNEVFETTYKMYLVLEYCGGGDLGAYLQRHGRVSADVARHFMRQLAAGLQVLRANNIVHGDLKPQNLLLASKEATPLLKIGDFGTARYLPPYGFPGTGCGTLSYMAPEILQNQIYDAKAESWSVGVILFQLLIGTLPYIGNTKQELLDNILWSPGPLFPQNALQALDPDCVDLCWRLLRPNPVERLKLEDFFNHRFLLQPRSKINKGKSIDQFTTSSHGSTSNNTDPPLCHCRMSSRLRTDYTRENYGRRFYCCRMYEDIGLNIRCGYFLWHDEPYSARATSVIADLFDQKQAMEMEKIALKESLKAKEAENDKLSKELSYTRNRMEDLQYRESVGLNMNSGFREVRTQSKNHHMIILVGFVVFGVILAKYIAVYVLHVVI